jgi:hydroxymethylpyrimidine/phosphomethylpyrimidine kinase
MDQDDFVPIMKRLDLITPNQDEFALFGFGLSASRDEIALGKDFALLLKGGHSQGKEAVDTLWTAEGQFKFTSPRLQGVDKHGTGCHLSSAILANLALGHTLPESCQIAKDYLTELLKSGEGRLAKDF